MVTKLDAESIERALNIDEEDIVEWVPGVDYASGRSDVELKDDVGWLAEWLGIKNDNLIEPKIVSYDDEDYSCYPIPVEKLKQKLEKEIKRRIKNIKKLLEEPLPDLHSIAY